MAFIETLTTPGILLVLWMVFCLGGMVGNWMKGQERG